MLAAMAAFTESCPACDAPWQVWPALIGKPAADFDGCAFRCLNCGIGFSNAKNPSARIRITATPEGNVPPEVQAGLSETLQGAINVRNRPTKRQKFCSHNSEDAVTWTVVSGLRAAGALGALVGDPDLGPPSALLLWGHAVDGPDATAARDHLFSISDALHENAGGRSEPDVIALWPNLLVFVETKHGSANDRHPNYIGYDTYLPAPGLFAVDDAAIRAEGSYQLMRNWVIGAAMGTALGVPLRLVNLGPAAIAEHAAGFAALLVQTADRRFEHRRWTQVLADGPKPPWLEAYAAEHDLMA
jgi:hypothetical protein